MSKRHAASAAVNANSFALICLLSTLLAACFRPPSLDRATLRLLFAEATQLLGSAPPSYSDIPNARLTTTIRGLKPQRVRALAEGLYIETGSFLVEEWGYFVPRDPDTFDPKASGDPSYEHLGEGVYQYEFKG